MSKLSDLFRWSKKLEIKEGDRVLDTVYLRLVGDADFQDAKNVSLKASKALRMKLKNIETEEYQASFSDLETLSREELAMGIVYGEITDYRDEAIVKNPEKMLPELSDNPTLEEQEEYEDLIEKIRTDRTTTLASYIEKRTEERKAELLEEEDDRLRELYHYAIINLKCNEEFTNVFRSYQIYKGTFKDAKFKELAFDSFDDFKSCSPQLKEILLQAYINLELSGDDLKN